MPRILRVLNRLNLGGPAINAAYLTHYLQPGFETLLVAGMIDKGEIHSSQVLEKFQIEPLLISSMHRNIRLNSDLSAYHELKKIIRQFKPDIVHTHAAKAGFLARLAAFNLNVPVIVHTFHGHVFHSYFPKLQTGAFIRLEKWIAGKTDRLIAVSESQKKELSEIYRIARPAKFAVIPLGMDLRPFSNNHEFKRSQFKKKFLISANDRVIVQAGRLVPVKNHRMLIRVIALLQPGSTKSLRFFIVGDGEEKRSLQQLATDLQIDWTEWNENPRPATLTFTGWQHEMDVIYSGADVVTLTSLNEGTPVTLIEAMASGCEIVATDIGGVANVLDGRFGSLAKPDHAEDFAGILRQKLLGTCSTKNGAGSNYALNQFSYQRLVSDMKKLYESLLNKN